MNPAKKTERQMPPKTLGDAAVLTDEMADDIETRPLTREQRRSKRKRAIRAKTVSIKRMTKREIELGRMLYPDTHERPRTRSECEGGPRPCVYVGCKQNLYLDINPTTGAIKLNFPDLEPEQMAHSCVLDEVERGALTLEETGEILNLTRERIRQLEVTALAKVEAAQHMFALRDFADEGPVGKRRLPVLVSVPSANEDTDDDDDEDDVQDSDAKLAAEAAAFALRVVR